MPDCYDELIYVAYYCPGQGDRIISAPDDWEGYYKLTAKSPPRKPLMKAVKSFENAGMKGGLTAVDLGCGAGRDTFALLKRGWNVLAIDAEPGAIKWIRSRSKGKHRGRLKTHAWTFKEARLPKADLVNASFCLPFCRPKDFPLVWARIRGSLRNGGRFSGNFFGDRDQWASDRKMTFQSASQVDELLRGFKVEYLKEIEEDGTTADGTPKHWHYFDVVAKKD